jgi:hypothetical protein
MEKKLCIEWKKLHTNYKKIVCEIEKVKHKTLTWLSNLKKCISNEKFEFWRG